MSTKVVIKIRSTFALLLFGFCLTQAAVSADNMNSSQVMEDVLALIQDWVGGTYDNSAQLAADVANTVPDNKKHTPHHQILTLVTINDFDGVTFFAQSGDGATEAVLGAGLQHFYPDSDSGMVKMRFHFFKESKRFIDAHLDLSILESVTLDDVRFNEGCEFYLSKSEDGSELRGAMKEDSCYFTSQANGQKIHHIDELVIRPGEYWNNARFYDLNGNFLHGNVSDDFVKTVRRNE